MHRACIKKMGRRGGVSLEKNVFRESVGRERGER
jgi:hypothetical protein